MHFLGVTVMVVALDLLPWLGQRTHGRSAQALPRSSHRTVCATLTVTGSSTGLLRSLTCLFMPFYWVTFDQLVLFLQLSPAELAPQLLALECRRELLCESGLHWRKPRP